MGVDLVHICVDGLNISLHQGSGIATYARTLLAVARDLGHETSALFGLALPMGKHVQAREAAFFGCDEQGAPASRLSRAVRASRAALLSPNRAVEIPRTGIVVREDRLDVATRIWNSKLLYDAAKVKFRLTGRLLTVPNPGGVDIAHWTCPLPIRMAGARNYYTIHDLIPLRYPYLTLDDAHNYHSLLLAILQIADRIVTVSDHSRSEIVEHLDVAPERVVNTSQAVQVADESDFSHGSLRIYALAERGYFLAFSAIEPKKNITRLIEAYLLLGTDKPLIIAGHFTWLPPADIRILTNLGLWDGHQNTPRNTDSIRFLGYVPLAHLDGLIRHATAVVFPSITEGFGLPIIEAMGRGTAVITSLGGATKETAGDAALLVDPMDPTAIAGAMRLLECDTGKRKTLEASGLERAKVFNIQHYRTRVGELYRL